MELKEVKNNLNNMVVYKGIKNIYRLTACILRKGKDGFYYSAELIDTKSNSVMYCRLNDIEV